MTSRTFERWTAIAALFVLISQWPLLSRPAGAAVAPEALLQPTPLVLKDGRMQAFGPKEQVLGQVLQRVPAPIKVVSEGGIKK